MEAWRQCWDATDVCGKESIDVDVEFLIGNLQQWKFEGCNLNLIKISVMNMQLNW